MKKTVLLIVSAAMIILTGCKTGTEHHANVIDSAVEGMEYQCGGLIQYTPKDGYLSCEHLPLGFKIGEIRLGVMYKIPSDNIILPQDIVGVKRDKLTDKNVVKLTVILQTLDSDHNLENGITITKETRDKLKAPIELKEMPLEEIEELIEEQLGKVSFQEPNKALKHLQKSMKKYNIK